MKRNSIILEKAISNLTNALYPEIKKSNIEIRIDEENADGILSFLLEKRNAKYLHIKKFARILTVAVAGKYNDDLYGKEPPAGKNVTAMKFKGKSNYRIICKEIFCDDKKIIMIALFHKKTQRLSKRDIAKYKTVGDYEYDC